MAVVESKGIPSTNFLFPYIQFWMRGIYREGMLYLLVLDQWYSRVLSPMEVTGKCLYRSQFGQVLLTTWLSELAVPAGALTLKWLSDCLALTVLSRFMHI